MPELPEVEAVCRLLRRALQTKRIAATLVVADPLVFSGCAPEAIDNAMRGRIVRRVGRLGKFFWLELGGPGPTLFAHLGMSGWVRKLGAEGMRLRGHGQAPFEDPEGRPRFLKLLLRAEDGTRIAFTDARRLGRIWLGASPENEPRVERLGRDAFDDLPSAIELGAMLARRRISIKAALLDQSILAGVGNWIADEVLYQSQVAPKRIASSLSKTEIASLRRAIRAVLARAVKVGADSRRFPKSWLFDHRWGGARGSSRIAGHAIVRERVAGRTTAWVPTRQR
jgi:formamidopyrimidine-DNA glycosylase